MTGASDASGPHPETHGDDLPVRPWHLPGLETPSEPEAAGGDAGRGSPWHRAETAGGASFRVPALDGERMASVVAAVRNAARAARRERDLDAVIEAVSRAATRLADPDSPWGRSAEALLRAELGWPAAPARETLRRMADGWTAGTLGDLVEAELGDPGLLDGYGPAPARDGSPRMRRAAGPPLLLQVQAGNVPGVGVTGVIRGLLVRSGLLVRPSRSEPGLAALFARSLADLAPELGRSVAVCWWPSEGEPAWRSAARRAGKVVVYGGDDAVRRIRARVPGDTELVPYGPRLGVAVMLPDASVRRAARRLAEDVCAYEQRGCVSPRVLLTPRTLRDPAARALEKALSTWVKENETAPLSPDEAADLRQLRGRAEFAGEGEARLVSDPGELRWTVLAGGEPSLRSRALPRVVRVHGVAGIGEVRRLLATLEGRVQALAYAGREGLRELADAAAVTGVSRLCPVGSAAWPPADWRHDGRHQLLPLLRWTDWELPGGEGRDG